MGFRNTATARYAACIGRVDEHPRFQGAVNYSTPSYSSTWPWISSEIRIGMVDVRSHGHHVSNRQSRLSASKQTGMYVHGQVVHGTLESGALMSIPASSSSRCYKYVCSSSSDDGDSCIKTSASLNKVGMPSSSSNPLPLHSFYNTNIPSQAYCRTR